MDGSIISVIVTEKNGLSLSTELNVEELMESMMTQDARDSVSLATKRKVHWSFKVN